MSGFVIWFCGLPGSGKSTISKLVIGSFKREGKETQYLSMDELRKKIFPNPTYSDEERDAAYRAFVMMAVLLSKNRTNVILDATAHKKIWRELARTGCEKFAVVYVKCPIEICIEREAKRENGVRKQLYLDALSRLQKGEKIEGLGKMPGIDEPFEEEPNPEVTIDSSKNNADKLARQVEEKLLEIGFL